MSWYVKVPLRRRDGSVRAWARVDLEDADIVLARPWYATANGYAARREGLMHRVVLGCQPGDNRVVDHINGDRLDNRRRNLRLVSQAENQQNRSPLRPVPRSGSRYRNVSWDKRARRWVVTIGHNYQRYHIGSFDSEEEAAEAARRARAELYTHHVETPREEAA